MPELTVFVPSRGRPDVVTTFEQAFFETSTENTRIVWVLDHDDPTRLEYIKRSWRGFKANFIVSPYSGMVNALNIAWEASETGFAIGFMGDDHRPRTHGWDKRYIEALKELKTGIAWGDDLLQGDKMPTQVAMTSDIPRALGYMAPPRFRHLCIDLVWKDWGEGIQRLRYLPDVTVEHLHPANGKAEMDEGYLRVNNPKIVQGDSFAYYEYKNGDGLKEDLEKLKELL